MIPRQKNRLDNIIVITEFLPLLTCCRGNNLKDPKFLIAKSPECIALNLTSAPLFHDHGPVIPR